MILNPCFSSALNNGDNLDCLYDVIEDTSLLTSSITAIGILLSPNNITMLADPCLWDYYTQPLLHDGVTVLSIYVIAAFNG